MHKIMPGVLMWLLCGIPCAQAQMVTPEAPAEAAEPERRYTVEIIIFEYAENAQAGDEVFIAEVIESPPGEPLEGELVFTDMPATLDNSAPGSKPSLAEIPLSRQIGLSLLNPTQYTMHDIYRKLRTLDAYKPIMHMAWTQTTVEKELTPPIRLRMLGNAPLRLDGYLTLYLSRYLHLVVDLALDADPSAQLYSRNAATSADAVSQGGYVYSDKPDLQPSTVRYRIMEDRIFKSGDLRYFDHPKFGVLAKVTRDESAHPNENQNAEQAAPIPAGTGSL
jgi:Peptidoglycan-binding protein, CsiV